MLTLLYFLFGPLLVLVAIIVADATTQDRQRRPGDPPGVAGYLGMFGAGVTFMGFMTSLG